MRGTLEQCDDISECLYCALAFNVASMIVKTSNATEKIAVDVRCLPRFMSLVLSFYAKKSVADTV